MRDKYTFLNVASFKNNLKVSLFRVFGDRGVEYEAIIYGRDQRGKTTKKQSFRHPHRSKVNAWRESRRGDARR